MVTNSSGLHARCALIALNHYPHFANRLSGKVPRNTVIEFAWKGQGQGYVSEVDDMLPGEQVNLLEEGISKDAFLDAEGNCVKAQEESKLITIGKIRDLAREEADQGKE